MVSFHGNDGAFEMVTKYVPGRGVSVRVARQRFP